MTQTHFQQITFFLFPLIQHKMFLIFLSANSLAQASSHTSTDYVQTLAGSDSDSLKRNRSSEESDIADILVGISGRQTQRRVTSEEASIVEGFLGRICRQTEQSLTPTIRASSFATGIKASQTVRGQRESGEIEAPPLSTGNSVSSNTSYYFCDLASDPQTAAAETLRCPGAFHASRITDKLLELYAARIEFEEALSKFVEGSGRLPDISRFVCAAFDLAVMRNMSVSPEFDALGVMVLRLLGEAPGSLFSVYTAIKSDSCPPIIPFATLARELISLSAAIEEAAYRKSYNADRPEPQPIQSHVPDYTQELRMAIAESEAARRSYADDIRQARETSRVPEARRLSFAGYALAKACKSFDESMRLQSSAIFRLISGRFKQQFDRLHENHEDQISRVSFTEAASEIAECMERLEQRARDCLTEAKLSL